MSGVAREAQSTTANKDRDRVKDFVLGRSSLCLHKYKLRHRRQVLSHSRTKHIIFSFSSMDRFSIITLHELP